MILKECGKKKILWDQIKNKLKILKIDVTKDDDKLIKIDLQNKSKKEKDVKIWLQSGILYN